MLEESRQLREQLHRRHCGPWPEALQLVGALQGVVWQGTAGVIAASPLRPDT
jgi:hypothetical protein